MDFTPLEQLQDFVAELLARRRAIEGQDDEELTLVYARALLLHALVRPALDDFPAQVVVIGPTQSGKSTVVNLLLGREAAQASPLAGFTRHAQGFSPRPVDDRLRAALDSLLPDLRRTDPAALDPEHLDQYALTEVPDADPFLTPPPLCWDTPDFDSVNSRHYRSVVPLLGALADVLVLVVSREKYADQAVWETLRLLCEVPRRLVVCVNKVGDTQRAELEAVVRDKFAQEGIATAALHTLPYLSGAPFDALLAAAGPLRAATAEAARAAPPTLGARELQAFLQRHWLEWTAPLRREHAADAAWRGLVDAALAEAREVYERDYLRNPDYGDTLQRAMVQLLELLEVPGLAAGLARLRQAITWPARTLGGLLKRQGPSAEQTARDNEAEVVTAAVQHALVQLQHQAAEEASGEGPSAPWWQTLWRALNERRRPLEADLAERITAHQRDFAPHIRDAAQRMYRHLQQSPATLNSLRAARVTADAAAVAVALKTGGIGLNDLVLAPAMLSFSSLLAETAVGRYMRTVEAELKETQMQSVQTHVLAPLREALLALPARMDDARRYGIDAERLARADAALEALA